MSRHGNSTVAGTVAEPLAMEGNHDEKFVISGGNPQPELSNSYGYASPGYVKSANAAQVEPHKYFVRPNGTVGNRVHANRASPPRHDENSGINHTGNACCLGHFVCWHCGSVLAIVKSLIERSL